MTTLAEPMRPLSGLSLIGHEAKMKMMFTLMIVLVIGDGLHAQRPAARTAEPAITINAAKFDAVYRAGKAVKVAADSDEISVLQFRALLMTLETEASIVSD